MQRSADASGVVALRDPITGTVEVFQKTRATKRKEALPDWVVSSRFDHYYRLAVNTRIPRSEGGKIMTRGDEIRVPHSRVSFT